MNKKPHFKDFLTLKPLRKKHIDDASKEPKEYTFQANTIAKKRHPNTQYGIIKSIEDITDDMKRLTFIPDKEKGTDSFATFEPGQYISIKYEKDGIKTARPYSICSLPSKDEYQVAIKKVDNGFTSSIVHNDLKVGDKIEFSSPEGQFVYSRLRDNKSIVALAGGSGITPFLSMAKSIEKGILDISLTLIYGARSIKDIAFKDELDKIAESCQNFKVVYVLSVENNPNYHHGFITEEIIKNNSDGNTSYFICGPKAMHKPMLRILNDMGVERKNIRIELFGEAMSITEFDDAPLNLPESVEITVRARGEVFVVKGTPFKTVMRNLEEFGVEVLNRCRSGVCGFCHSALLKGQVYVPKIMDHLREADRIYNQIHLCSAFPITDITIEICKPGGNL